MTCRDFERWLDLGRPHTLAPEAERHAAGCALCAERLAADRAIEALLDAPPSPSPAPFTDTVMSRVEASTRARLHGGLRLDSAVPWWARAATQPSAVLALLLAGLAGWQGMAAARLVAGAALALTRAGEGLGLAAFAGASARAEVTTALGVAIAPLAAGAAWALFRACERLVRIATPLRIHR